MFTQRWPQVSLRLDDHPGSVTLTYLDGPAPETVRAAIVALVGPHVTTLVHRQISAAGVLACALADPQLLADLPVPHNAERVHLWGVRLRHRLERLDLDVVLADPAVGPTAIAAGRLWQAQCRPSTDYRLLRWWRTEGEQMLAMLSSDPAG